MGIALLVLSTLLILVVGVYTYFQPREYTSSVFVSLDPPDRSFHVESEVIDLVLVIAALYTPGLLLLLLAWFFGRFGHGEVVPPPI